MGCIDECQRLSDRKYPPYLNQLAEYCIAQHVHISTSNHTTCWLLQTTTNATTRNLWCTSQTTCITLSLKCIFVFQFIWRPHSRHTRKRDWSTGRLSGRVSMPHSKGDPFGCATNRFLAVQISSLFHFWAYNVVFSDWVLSGYFSSKNCSVTFLPESNAVLLSLEKKFKVTSSLQKLKQKCCI